jgi:hypothetical protein
MTGILNVYLPNIRTPTYIKELSADLKGGGEIVSNTTIGEDFISAHSIMDRSPSQKINKEPLDFNCM